MDQLLNLFLQNVEAETPSEAQPASAPIVQIYETIDEPTQTVEPAKTDDAMEVSQVTVLAMHQLLK